MSYGKKYQCETANGAIPYYFKGYYCGIYMIAQKGGNDIPLASSLRESCYKNHLFMGWYFPRRELGYRPEMTVLSHRRQGIHRETARYIRLDCGVYRYRGCRYLLCQSVSTALAVRGDMRRKFSSGSYFSLPIQHFDPAFSLKMSM